MIKKHLSIIFAFALSLVLLGQLSMPHHHHHQLICYDVEHCADEAIDSEHKEHGCEDAHHHDKEQNHDHSSKNCFLHTSTIISPTSKKEFDKEFETTSDFVVCFVLFNSFYPNFLPEKGTQHFVPPNATFYCTFTVPNSGVRGSPIC